MSNTLFSCFPNADDLVTLGPEDLAPVLLRLAVPRLQSAGVQFEAVIETPIIEVQAGRDWPFYKKPDVIQASKRAWKWLDREGFIEPAAGMNGRNGWYNITEKGRQVAEGHDIVQPLLRPSKTPCEKLAVSPCRTTARNSCRRRSTRRQVPSGT